MKTTRENLNHALWNKSTWVLKKQAFEDLKYISDRIKVNGFYFKIHILKHKYIKKHQTAELLFLWLENSKLCCNTLWCFACLVYIAIPVSECLGGNTYFIYICIEWSDLGFVENSKLEFFFPVSFIFIDNT